MQIAIAGDALGLPFYGGRLLALAFLGRLLVELSTTNFSQNAGFFAGALEPPEGSVKIFVLFYANGGQCVVPRNQKTGLSAGWAEKYSR